MNLPIQQPTMSSLQIAEVAGKQHRHVLAAIRKMEEAWYKVRGSKFRLTFRDVAGPNGAMRQESCYNLTKEECLYIATKFNDEARARLIMRWMELERQQITKPASISEIFAESRQVVEDMRKDLEAGNNLPALDITPTPYDIAVYSYLRNGIKSATDTPFCINATMISKALGIDVDNVKQSWQRLEQGGYIVSRKFGDNNRAFILGSRLP